MDADHERVLTLVAAAVLGALLGGPALALIRALLKAVGQLAVVTLLAVGVFFLVQRGWPSPRSDNTPPPESPGASDETLPISPSPGPWWRSSHEDKR